MNAKWLMLFGLATLPFPCSADYSITRAAGFYLIANQVNHPSGAGIDNRIATLFLEIPDNTTFYKFDQSLNGGAGGLRAWNFCNDQGWFPYPPDATMNPGEAVMISAQHGLGQAVDIMNR